MAEKLMTNREFTKNAEFIAACEEAGIKPTVRQASKFRNSMGKAFKNKGLTTRDKTAA